MCSCCNTSVFMMSMRMILSEYFIYVIPGVELLQSFVRRVMRSGEITEPCGAPVTIVLTELRSPFTLTYWGLAVRKDMTQRIRWGLTSIGSSLRSIRCGCRVLKALKKSTKNHSNVKPGLFSKSPPPPPSAASMHIKGVGVHASVGLQLGYNKILKDLHDQRC